DNTKFSGTLSIGGGGGAAGSGALVTVDQSGAGRILTYGDDAEGVRAQSIGGGGGNGGLGTAKATVKKEEKKDDAKSAGDAKSADKDGAAAGGKEAAKKDDAKKADEKKEASNKPYVFNLAVGGSGGASGSGGDVKILQSKVAAIATQGDRSTAILAQSIGGGGGKGAVGTADSGHGEVAGTVALGGSGGAAGHGGAISIVDSGTITTMGMSAHGIHAQSVGGGGGIAAGSNSQAGGQVKLSLGASAGGSGGSAGHGGKVEIEHGGKIGTQGEAAYGLFAQSIGGGGGYAASSKLASEAKQQGSLALGQAGGAGGNGDKVTVRQLAASEIATIGRNAHAVFAQSVGGGGGVGGASESENKLDVRLGGAGGKGGSGGEVLVDAKGKIATAGAGAYGVLAQSVGGGGGVGVDSAVLILGKVPMVFDAVSGAQGEGGKVTVAATGEITTLGENAAAIFAQSVGGGGGMSAKGVGAGKQAASGSRGGKVDVTVNGAVRAYGNNAPGIFAQSTGSAGGSRIDVHVGPNGIVQGGAGEHGAAIILANGNDNHVIIDRGAHVSALSGKAILTQGAVSSTSVVNAGTLSGSVSLGGMPGNTLHNQASGRFNAGAVVDLGKAGLLENQGVFNPGGPGAYGGTRLTGNYRQPGASASAPGGVYEPNVDFRANKSGKLTVDGNAELDGTVRTLGRYQLPERRVGILEVDGANHTVAIASGLKTENPLVYDYKLHRDGDKALGVSVDAHFDVVNDQLSSDEVSLANYVQGRWKQATDPALAEFADVFDHFANVRTVDEYRRALAEVANDLNQAPAVTMPAKSQAFINLMMSCPEFQSGDASMREGSCYWGRVIGAHTKRTHDGEDQGFSSNGMTYQIGGQKALNEHWILGGSAAFETSRLRGTDSPVRTDGKSFNAGVVVKRQDGPWLFAGALNVGHGSYDTERNITVSGNLRTADSSWKSTHVAARLRGQYTYAQSNWYLKPLMDLDLAYQKVPGYSESGAGAFNLQMKSADRWNLTVTPALELGGRFDFKDYTLRPYVSVGVNWMSNNSWKVKTGLQGDPSSDTFLLQTSMPRVTGDVRTGLELMNRKGLELKAEYNVRFARNYTTQQGMLRLAVHF
ncbi:MAG: autotransporter outer membrane beta-barrel domain-containing protein, partial [Candidimonas sp.]